MKQLQKKNTRNYLLIKPKFNPSILRQFEKFDEEFDIFRCDAEIAQLDKEEIWKIEL